MFTYDASQILTWLLNLWPNASYPKGSCRVPYCATVTLITWLKGGWKVVIRINNDVIELCYELNIGFMKNLTQEVVLILDDYLKMPFLPL